MKESPTFQGEFRHPTKYARFCTVSGVSYLRLGRTLESIYINLLGHKDRHMKSECV